MSFTRANAEVVLLARHGPKMTAAGMDGATQSGANPAVVDPLVTALLKMGYTPASAAAVTDADLAKVETERLPELLERAELRLLENIAGNLDDVDITLGPRREALNQLAQLVERAIDRLTARLAKEYGAGLGSLSAGAISLDFAEKFDDEL